MKKTSKKRIAGLLAASLLLAECSVYSQPVTASAASTPTVAKSLTIMAGKKKTIKVKGTFIKSKAFKSSKTKIATVSKKGVVTAKKAGNCKITVTVKYRKKKNAKKLFSKKLTCKVTVKSASVTPTPAAEQTAVPTPDSTPTVTPSATPAVTAAPADRTVATQEELDAALKESATRSLTLKTDSAEKFMIPAGEYKNIDLTVNAPNADIENNGVFQSVTVQAVKADTWTEKAKGNVFTVTAPAAHIIVAKEADVSKMTILNTAEKPKLTITAEGNLGLVAVRTAAELVLDGKRTEAVSVTTANDAKDVEITAKIPVTIAAETNGNITLEKGAEGSKIVVNSASLSAVKIKNNTGAAIEVVGTDGTKLQEIPAGGEADTSSMAASPSPAATPGLTQFVPVYPGISIDSTPAPEDTKDKEDADALRAVIKAQRALGATVSEDLDSEEYTWSEDGRLTGINWNRKNLQGSLALQGLPKLLKLSVDDNQLSGLDVSTNTMLAELSCKNGYGSTTVKPDGTIETITGGTNQFASLDFSNNTSLTSLVCSKVQLESLDISSNTALADLDCQDNKLISLDVSNNTALATLDCSSNRLSALDVSRNTVLTTLDCAWNALLALDVGHNISLTYLDCSMMNSFAGGKLADLDVSQNTLLTYLDCSYNQLKKLDVSQNTLLTFLNCGRNQLQELDVTNNTALTDLCCGADDFGMIAASYESLDFAILGKMIYTDGSSYQGPGNYLSTLDVSKNIALERLNCSNNVLSDLDVSRNTALTYLVCRGNRLKDLDVSSNVSLKELVCYSNQLTNLNVGNNTALETLWCDDNQLGSLDVSRNSLLKKLSCKNAQLTDLDISQNTKLWAVNCAGNGLTNLDVGQNTELYLLNCAENGLTSLDVSQNIILRTLMCDSTVTVTGKSDHLEIRQ